MSFCSRSLAWQTQLLPAARVRILKIFWSSLLAGCAATVAFAVPDPVESLKSFSSFRSIDLSRLLEGDILGERGSLMEFPQGIFAQTCFVLPVTAVEAAQRLQTWNPTRHEALKVLAFNPVCLPCKGADFEGLDLRSGNRALR